MDLRNRVLLLLPGWLRALLRHLRSRQLLSPHARASFSQEGEDLVLHRLFERQPHGFYVDVGAHHPARFSNTKLLYDRGWHGINIDPTPGCMDAFHRARQRDVNLELAISDVDEVRHLFVFDEPALNSLSEELSYHRNRNTDYTLGREVEVRSRTLADVLAEHLPLDVTTIDLLSIDVEGYDLDVLKSNDWDRFRPRVVVIEVLRASLGDLPDAEEIQFLTKRGYRLYAKLVNSVVLRDEAELD